MQKVLHKKTTSMKADE